MKYFAVHTKPQKESLVAYLLGMQGFEVLWLHYPHRRHQAGAGPVLRSYFPRYVFVGLEPGQAMGNVNDTMGVSSVLCQGDEPLEIPRPVVDELRLRADETGLLHLTPEETTYARKLYRRGQKVQITEGILQGLQGTIELDKGHRISVLIEMFRGTVPASLEPEALAPF